MDYKPLLFLFVFLILNTAHSFKLTPMNITLKRNKKNARAIVTLKNGKNEKKVALKIYATTREIDINGKEIRKLTKDIRVYPPQVILNSSDIRNVRVSYHGDFDTKKEKSYRLIAEQLPVEGNKLGPEKANIKILLKYVASLYYAPLKGKKKIKLLKSSIKDDGSSILLSLKNIGEHHQIIKDISFYYLDDKKKKIEFLKNPKKLVGVNFLSGMKRDFKIKISKNFKLKKGSILSMKIND